MFVWVSVVMSQTSFQSSKGRTLLFHINGDRGGEDYQWSKPVSSKPEKQSIFIQKQPYITFVRSVFPSNRYIQKQPYIIFIKSALEQEVHCGYYGLHVTMPPLLCDIVLWSSDSKVQWIWYYFPPALMGNLGIWPADYSTQANTIMLMMP